MAAFQGRLRIVKHLPGPTWLLLGGLGALVVYLGVAWLVLLPGTVWSPDEGAKLLQLLSFRIQDGQFRYDIVYPGLALDPQLEFALSDPSKDLLRVNTGQLMFERLPVFPLLAWPLHRGFGVYGLSLIPALAGAAIGLLSICLLEPGDRRAAMWVLIAFGSPVFIYSVIFWEHTLATGLGLAGVGLIFQAIFSGEISRSHKLLTWCGAVCLLAAAVYIRLEIALLAAALLLSGWLLHREQRGWFVMAGVLLALALLPYAPFHNLLFGQGVPINARYLNLPLAYLRHAKWEAIPDLLVGPSDNEGIQAGWMGVLWSVATVMAVGFSLFPKQTWLTRSLVRIGLVGSATAAGYFLFTRTGYRSAHGLLLSTPWAVLGLTRATETWRTGGARLKMLLLTCVFGLAAYTVVMLGLRASSPQGGLEWGARFVLSFYPLLALAVAWDWRDKPIIDRVIIGALICLGLAFQVRGLLTIQHDQRINAALNRAVASTPEQNVLSDLWWLTLNAASIYQAEQAPAHKAFFAAATPDEMANWVRLAASRQVNQFTLVTLNYALPTELGRRLYPDKVVIHKLIQVESFFIYRLSVKP